MRISRIAVESYANFENVDFATDDSLVIVGENKAGKSNLLRALRLVLDPTLPDRDRQLGLGQFWDGLGDAKLGATVKVFVEFTDFEDNDNLLTVLGGSVVDTETPVVARLTYLYRSKANLEGVTPESLAEYEFLVFGGIDEDNAFTAARRRELPMDYLFALRDAESDLLNWRRSPLRPIIEELTAGLNEETREELKQLVSNAQSTLAQRPEVSAAAAYPALALAKGQEGGILRLGCGDTSCRRSHAEHFVWNTYSVGAPTASPGPRTPTSTCRPGWTSRPSCSPRPTRRSCCARSSRAPVTCRSRLRWASTPMPTSRSSASSNLPGS